MLASEFISCELAISQAAPKKFFRPGRFLAKASGAPGCRPRRPLTLILSPDGGEEILRWRVWDCGAADRWGPLFLSPWEGERIKLRGPFGSESFRFLFHAGSSGKMRFGSKASFRRRMSFTGRSALGILGAWGG